MTLAVLFLAALLALPTQAVDSGYKDVEPDAWYAWCVRNVSDHGLMNGTGGGTFTPDGNLTRAMLVTVLWRLAGEPEARDTAVFSDVPAGQWYSDAIAWASGFNVVEGYGNRVFGTNDPVTREQMAVIFYRWAKGQEYDTQFTPNPVMVEEENHVSHYEWDEQDGINKWLPSGKPISDWATDAVQWAAEHDFLVRRQTPGTDPKGGVVYRYCVWEDANRAEVAVFLSRFFRAYIGEAEGSPAAMVPFTVDGMTMDLPESWMGSVNPNSIFWDLTNHKPWSGWGRLFTLMLYDTKETKNVPDAVPAQFQSGRLCTIKGKGIGTKDVVVLYAGDDLDESGTIAKSEAQFYDPDNPRSYLKLRDQIAQVLHTIRFSEDVEILYLAPFLSAPLETKTTLPETPAHTHVWSADWTFDSAYHWHTCTAEDCPIDGEDHEKLQGYGSHVYSSWTTVVESGERTAGLHTRTCAICGYEEREIIPAKLPTADSYTLDLRKGSVQVTGTDLTAVQNSLQAAGAFYGQQPLSGEPAYYEIDLDKDGTKDLTAEIKAWETAPDKPRKPTSLSYAAARSFRETELSFKPDREALDRYLALGQPIFGQVIIKLPPENVKSGASIT